MSDLISRSELLEIIKGSEELLDFQKDECIACINSCDIAYDVNKVVEELETMSQHITFKDMFETHENVRMVSTDIAIKIAKQGGVFNDMCEWEKAKSLNAYKSITHAEMYNSRVLDWKVCPYCGKKIKIVGD